MVPSTPATSRSSVGRYPLSSTYRPINSSPLASPDGPKSSPAALAQARRRSQYKSRTPSTPAQPSFSQNFPRARSISASGGSVFSGSSGGKGLDLLSGEGSQKSFLREKFKARCIERAVKARAKAVRGKRYTGTSEASSDGFDDAMDEDDDEDEDILQDELFRRLMENINRKDRHSYRVSYAQEVGSSFDPDMEDIDRWEEELHKLNTEDHSSHESPVTPRLIEELTPIDLDDEELQEYAEEYARRAAIADFENIPEEDLFRWSDIEENTIYPSNSNSMDLS